MDIKIALEQIMQAYQAGQMAKPQWMLSLAELLKDYDPLELAIILKEFYHMNAQEIACALSKISADYPAVTVGAILLNKLIYPQTTADEMKGILANAFPQENIEKAILVLYPVTLSVDARSYWFDTGIDIDSDEIVTLSYKRGLWNINPSQPSCDGNGINIIAKLGYALPGFREGCLVGKVPDGMAEYIGNHTTLPGPRKGRLYLAANDDIKQRYGAGYQDNSGQIEVEIQIELR